MTPLDFLDFRSSLEGASGFQSTQFRQIEATLGLRMENRFRPDYYKHTEMGGFSPADYGVIVEAEKTTTLLQLVEQWLARMPFFEESFWDDWDERGGDASAEPGDRRTQLNPASGTATGSSTKRVSPIVMRKETCWASSTRRFSRPGLATFLRRHSEPLSSSCSTATNLFSASRSPSSTP